MTQENRRSHHFRENTAFEVCQVLETLNFYSEGGRSGEVL